MSEALSGERTHLAWLTPLGKGAIGVLAIRGPRAWAIVRELFQPMSSRPLGQSPPEPKAGRFWLGWLGETGRPERDQVVLTVKRAGPSPWLEVHCHGGRQVSRFLEELFAARGVQCCSWQEVERLTGEDPGKAAALAALAHAPTARVAAILLDQYNGAFARAMAEARAALDRQDLVEAGRLLDCLLRYVPVGRHLTAPWRVAILGAPNVGKSSLANRLAGYQRSVVSPVAGTTRDVVSTLLAVDGWPVELIDTAGWREGAEDLEGQGIALARQAGSEADLCLWVLDASAPPVWPNTEVPGTHFVINKTDLQAVWDLGKVPDALHVSALTAVGVAELLEALARWLVPDPPSPGAAAPFTPEQCSCVQEARRLLAGGHSEEAWAVLQGKQPH
jgi:tRNA modification GTPase